MEDVLSPSRIAQDGIFNPRPTEALVKKFRSGQETSTKDNMALIGILSTTLFITQFVRGRGA